MRHPPVTGPAADAGAPAAVDTVPVGLRVAGRAVLVVGAGPIAARKASLYVERGAEVTVVAPAHCRAMEALTVTHRIRRPYRPCDLDGMWLVITATGDPGVDGAVFADAESRRIWCNAADDPSHCSALLPAVSRRGAITVSIATGGRSPATASWLRRRIDALIDDATLDVFEVVSRVRDRVRAAGRPTNVSGWAEILDDEALDLARRGELDQLESRLYEAVTR